LDDGAGADEFGSIEILGEACGDFCQQGAALVGACVLGAQFVEIQSGAQFEGERVLDSGLLDRLVVCGLGR
jgi:hypothetical protein